MSDDVFDGKMLSDKLFKLNSSQQSIEYLTPTESRTGLECPPNRAKWSPITRLTNSACSGGTYYSSRGRGNRSFGRLAGSHRIRVGSWNVGSLTCKFFELGDVLRRQKVDIACFQETKWKGSRAREGNGYKL
nr:craniofacial development protein 2-like [Tanacetum cinerariifolium]